MKSIVKPCPFCGCEKIEVRHELDGGYPMIYCKCTNCYARGGGILKCGGQDNRALAIEKWNTRKV